MRVVKWGWKGGEGVSFLAIRKAFASLSGPVGQAGLGTSGEAQVFMFLISSRVILSNKRLQLACSPYS